MNNVSPPTRSTYDVSDVKADGTVFVRFKSSMYCSGVDLATAFRIEMQLRGMSFFQVEENKFRVAIDQFESLCEFDA